MSLYNRFGIALKTISTIHLSPCFSDEEIEKVVLGPSGRSHDKIQIKSVHGMDLKVIQGDLFKVDKSFSLCHCVSADFKLGKGIAKIFREKFGRVDELQRSGAGVGGVAVLKDNGRFVLLSGNKAMAIIVNLTPC